MPGYGAGECLQLRDGEGSWLRSFSERVASQAILYCFTDVQALKHYFLMDRGDLLETFLDSAEDEMAKPLQQVSLPRLQTLLDLGEGLLWISIPSTSLVVSTPCHVSTPCQTNTSCLPSAWESLKCEGRQLGKVTERKSGLGIFKADASAAVRSSSGVAEAKGEELFCTIDTRRLQPMLHDLAPPKGNRKLRLPFVRLLRYSLLNHKRVAKKKYARITVYVIKIICPLAYLQMS